MTALTVAGLQHLLAPHDSPCISLFLPTSRQLQGAKEDAIRYKNLLAKAERLLSGRPSRTVASLLEPLRGRVENGPPAERLDGLAVFRSPDVDLTYRLPASLPERLVVADSFHIRPLIRFLQSNQRYFVLALSQHRVTLFEGTRAGLRPARVGHLPQSLEEVLERDRQKDSLSGHAAAAGGGGGPAFHGHGEAEDRKKADLVQFFRAVDEALWDVLRDEHAPLVLAGVGYYHPLYRSICRYSRITRKGVEGNFEKSSAADLHAKTWPLIEDVFGNQERAALDEFQRVRGRGLGTDHLPAVAKAAVQGRVRRLLVARGARAWGVLDPVTGDLESHVDQRDARDDDIVDDLAEAVLARGGEVLMLDPERLPSGAPVAAVLRW